MTEVEWLACNDSMRMLDFLRASASDRKMRLFACACCWRLESMLPEKARQLLSAVELSADVRLSASEMNALSDEAMAYSDGLSYQMGDPDGCARWLTSSAVWHASESNALQTCLDAARAVEIAQEDPADFDLGPALPSKGDLAERRAQADLLRDVVANPFGRVSIARPVLAWGNGTVAKIAQAIYDERAFEYLPILADALEDAGCDDADILRHCREPGEHVRGCWVVDLLLGKA
jgi:hypothetical protein